jgi:beta-lactamase class A
MTSYLEERPVGRKTTSRASAARPHCLHPGEPLSCRHPNPDSMHSAARALRAFLVPAAVVLVCHGQAQPSVSDLLLQRTEERVRAYVQQYEGVVGVAFIDLTTGRSHAINGDVAFPQASSIKIPIMIRVFQAEREGLLKLGDAVAFTPRDLVRGSGNLKQAIAAGPMSMPLLDVVTAMIEHSDNSATNKCIALVGQDRVNRMLDEMGFVRTRLRRVMQDPQAIRNGWENISTPNEMAAIASQLWRGRLVDADACRQMLEILKKVKGPMREALPADVTAATKTGGMPGVNCQSGVILVPERPFALSVMSTFNPPDRQPIADITRIVYDAFARLASANEWGHAWRRPPPPRR